MANYLVRFTIHPPNSADDAIVRSLVVDTTAHEKLVSAVNGFMNQLKKGYPSPDAKTD